MKQAKVYMHDLLAGVLTEDEDGYHFEYDAGYLVNEKAESVSLTLPLAVERYDSEGKVLFPFFDGLIPEGWLLEVTVKNWKIDPKDRMGLLLATCGDCIGAVSVQPIDE